MIFCLNVVIIFFDIKMNIIDKVLYYINYFLMLVFFGFYFCIVDKCF